MAQITATIASTTTMIVAAAVTMPMTTLKRIHAAMSSTSSAIARRPSEERRGSAEVDMLEAYLPRGAGSRGRPAFGRGSVVACAQVREAFRRGGPPDVERHARQPVAAHDGVRRGRRA